MGYDDHLDRAMDETPEAEGSSSRFSIPDVDVRTEGNVTVYENFRETVDRLGRESDHVMKYLQTELGTSASIDERNRLRLTGSFRQDRIRNAVEAYADAYVLCPECGLPDTKLTTENGPETLSCEACGARSAAGD